MSQGTTISEAQLRRAVEEVFKKYDINADSRLQKFELVGLFNDTLAILKKERMEFLEYADKNKDRKIDKEEMFAVFYETIKKYNARKKGLI